MNHNNNGRIKIKDLLEINNLNQDYMGNFFEDEKAYKKILLTILFFLFIGYIGLLLYTHSDYEENGFWYDLSEQTIIIRKSILYWVIGAGISAVILVIMKRIIDRQQEYRLRSKNVAKEIGADEKKGSSPMNQFVVMCFSFWIIINLCRVGYQFVYIINSIDTGIHLYNIIVGLLCCILLYKISRGHKMSFFLFYVFEITNGVVISDIEKDYSGLLFSFFASVIVSVLLLFKNKSGQTGYDVLFKDKSSEHEYNIATPLVSKETNQYGSILATNESGDISMMENASIGEVQKNTDSLYCKSCGKLIDGDSLYCNHCGTKIKM